MAKAAKLASQARLPEAANPLAALTRFDSAMPTLKKRSGNFLAKKSVRVELWTSPSRTTMSGYCSPIFASAIPNASLTDFPIRMVVFSLVRSAGVQQRQGLLHLFGRQRLAVVVGVLAQNALDRPALDRLGDDDTRPALHRGGLLQGVEGLLLIVPVDLLPEPAERLPLRCQRREVEDFLRGARLLIAVLIVDGDEVFELELVSGHGGFPDLALVNLAVAAQDVDARVEAVQADGEGVADADRQ